MTSSNNKEKPVQETSSAIIGKEHETILNDNMQFNITKTHSMFYNGNANGNKKLPKQLFQSIGDEGVSGGSPSNEAFIKLRQSYLRSDKDLPLKVLTSYLFSFIGYTTFIKVPIIAYTYGKSFRRSQVSDVDVFAVKFESDLTSTAIAIECKSGEGYSLDYLLKLDGIRKYMGTQRGILVQRRIPDVAREVAVTLDITTWDEKELYTVLRNLGVEWNVVLDPLINIYIKKSELRKISSKKLPKIHNFLYIGYWTLPTYKNIQTIIRVLPQINPLTSDDKESCLLLVDEAVLLLGLAILDGCRYVIRNYLAKPIDGFKDYLFGGAVERREREILFDKINQQLGVSNPFLPDYFYDLCELALRFINAPEAASNILNLWSSVIDKRLANEDWQSFVENSEPKTLKLTKDLLAFALKFIRNEPEHWTSLIKL